MARIQAQTGSRIATDIDQTAEAAEEAAKATRKAFETKTLREIAAVRATASASEATARTAHAAVQALEDNARNAALTARRSTTLQAAGRALSAFAYSRREAEVALDRRCCRYYRFPFSYPTLESYKSDRCIFEHILMAQSECALTMMREVKQRDESRAS